MEAELHTHGRQRASIARPTGPLTGYRDMVSAEGAATRQVGAPVTEHLPPPESTSWVQWAIGGVAAAGVVVAGWLYSAVQSVRKDDEAARAALWTRVNAHSQEDAEFHLDAERRFATKSDIERLEQRIRESEARIINAIAARSPVRGGGRV